MKALLGSESVWLSAPDFTLELLPSEQLVFRPALQALDVVSQRPVVASTAALRLNDQGRHVVRLTHPNGSTTDLKLVCLDPRWLPQPNDLAARAAVRAQAQSPDFDGTFKGSVAAGVNK